MSITFGGVLRITADYVGVTFCPWLLATAACPGLEPQVDYWGSVRQARPQRQAALEGPLSCGTHFE